MNKKTLVLNGAEEYIDKIIEVVRQYLDKDKISVIMINPSSEDLEDYLGEFLK